MRSVILAGLLALSAGPALAQTVAKGEVGGGWNLITVSNTGFETQTAPAGWFGEVAGNVNRLVTVVGTLGGNYKTVLGEPLHVHAVAGGLRFNHRGASTIVPFGQVLFGTGSFSVQGGSVTKPGLDVGGGVNAWVRPGLGIRVGGDFLNVFSKGDGLEDTLENVHVFRLTAGVVVPVGRR